MKGGWHGPKFSECYFAAGDRRNFAGRFSMGENKTYYWNLSPINNHVNNIQLSINKLSALNR